MRVGFYQMNPGFGKKAENLDIIRASLLTIDADLIVLPEFCATGYLFMDIDEVKEAAEAIPDGLTCGVLKEIALNKSMSIVAGLPEIDPDGKLYNSSVFISPDGRIWTYRKTHLFDREKEFFERGDTGFFVISASTIRIGMMICYDWIYPESARSLSLMGADLIAHPSNLVLPFCPDAMVTRCIENRIFAVTCNRIGIEKRGNFALRYIGNSRIIDPVGSILAQGSSDEICIKTVEITETLARNKSITERNHLFNDRRPEHYSIMNNIQFVDKNPFVD